MDGMRISNINALNSLIIFILYMALTNYIITKIFVFDQASKFYP